MDKLKQRITPSFLISLLALFVALGGVSYAALGKNSVGSNQLKNNAVTTKKIKKNAVTGAKVKESSLGIVPKAKKANHTAGYSTFPQTKFTAVNGADYDTARNAAKQHVMFKVGPITVYAKCFTDTSGPTTYSKIYAKTSQNGVIFDSDEDQLDGDPAFLDTNTAENDRELLYEDASTDSATVDLDSSYAATFMTPGGVAFEAQIQGAAKNGNLTNGNGVYGSGNVCLVDVGLTQYTG